MGTGSHNGDGQKNRGSRSQSASGSLGGGISVDASSSGTGSNIGADTAGLTGEGSSGLIAGGRGVSPPRWLGKRVGRFRLLALLGQGAMGRVFRAEDTLMGRHVALKLLPRTLKDKAGVSVGPELLIREARAAAAIEHPNAVAVYEVNQAGDVCYVAMELLEGGSLRELVRAAGPMDLTRACLLCAEAAEALAAAHAAGVVHRDVKPANLMLSRNGRCKVVDFGLARLDEAGRGAGQWAGNAAAAENVGTPQFIAPEILQGTPASAASDVYSLGGTLFYLLTGRPPFEAKSARELLKMHVSAPVPDLRSFRPDASRGLADALARALAKRPADRWATMEQFARVLRVHAIPIAAAEGSGAIAAPSPTFAAGSVAGYAPPPTPSYMPSGPVTAPPASPNRSARPASPMEAPLPQAEVVELPQVAPAPVAPQAPTAPAANHNTRRTGSHFHGVPAWPLLAGAGVLIAAVVAVLCIVFLKGPPKDVASNGTTTPTPPAPTPVAPAQAPTPSAAARTAISSPTPLAPTPPAQAPAPAAPQVVSQPAPEPAPVRPPAVPQVVSPSPTLRVGDFDGDRDIGEVGPPGSVQFDAGLHQYNVTGSGMNIWMREDAFHFLYRKMSGDLTLKADLQFKGNIKDRIRKGVLMVRQSLEPNAPYVDVAIQGDWSTFLQYRLKPGERADSKPTKLRGSTIWLVRRGNRFVGYVAREGKEPQPAFEMDVPLTDPVYVGLGVCSHDPKETETVTFSDVEIDKGAKLTELPPAQPAK
jgi:serine/threonine protein kinase